ncbi:MAG: M23 family metallopeptidase [Rhodanobacter sp.]
MKLLLAFIAGVACGAALMFGVVGAGWLARGAAAIPVAAPGPVAVITPAPEIALAVRPVSVTRPAAEPHVPGPINTDDGVSVALPAPAATAAAAVAVDQAPVPADVPASAVSGLLIPVQGVELGELRDTFTQARTSNRVHDAIDIMAARGTPVLAANAGRVVKLFTSKPGGLTVYQFDPAERVIYYYAHLDSYAPGLAEGKQLQRGDPIGTVGSTGNASADAPHLHFEVELLGPEKQWWHATSINPYGRFAGQP